MFRRKNPVAVDDVLILIELCRLAEETLDRAARARSGNVVTAVRQLHAKQIDGDRIDVRAVALDADASRRESAHRGSQPLLEVRGLTIAGHRIQRGARRPLRGDAVSLAGSLVAAEEEHLVFHDRAAEASAKLVLF